MKIIMANSESDDFESADEEVPKLQVTENLPSSSQKISTSVFKPLKKNSKNNLSEVTQEVSMPPEEQANSSDSLQEASLVSELSDPLALATPHNPDFLGAKPKIPQKSKSKFYSKNTSHEDSLETGAPVISNITTNTINQDLSHKRKSGPSKLGMKISSSKLSSNVDFERSSRATEALTENASHVSAEKQSVNDSIQPLLQKLSLDVSDLSDSVSASIYDQSLMLLFLFIVPLN